jgi:uncharacterized protein YqhQ
MNWTEKDKHLFTIVNQSGKYHLENQIRQASNKYFTLKKIPDFYSIFGYYDMDSKTFHWENKMNEHSYSITKQKYINIFGSDSTLKKLFRPTVRFSTKYMNIIPYLMEALNENLNVVRVKSFNGYIYALTNVEGIHKTFNLDIFEEALIHYRNEKEVGKVRVRNYTRKKKNQDVSECKEKLV